MNKTYVVKAGDTLYGISNQFGVSVTELASLNNIKGDNLKIGQVLTIPSNTGTNPNNMFMYTVKKGDTLYGIATKYNTSVQKIMDLNYLKSINLDVGQVLRIPEMYTPSSNVVLPNYISYTVKKGDTLYSIGNKYLVDVATIVKDNALDSTNLSIGQVLKIRVNDDGDVIECFGEEYVPDVDKYTSYTVLKGDSLYSIARKFGTSVNKLIEANNLKSNTLSIGQVLKIPADVYIVKSGDSLYSIAKKYNTTVDSIKVKNNLKSNLLSIGQKLFI